MMQMTMNPIKMIPIMGAATVATMQKTAEVARETPVAEHQDKKDDITTQVRGRFKKSIN